MGIITKFAALPTDEKNLLVASTVGLVVSAASLRLFPFRLVWKGTRRLSDWSRGRAPRDEATENRRIRDITTQIARAARHLPAATCLPQALTGYWLLNRAGITTELRIGVRREKQIEAHAWLERNGKVILGGSNAPDVFEPFDSLQDKLP